MSVLRGTSGAIDLASIMAGVLVLGIVGGVIAATVFAVVPWSQDQAAQADLGQVRVAEGVYAASHAGGFADLSTLQAPTLMASGSGGPGQPGASISAAGIPLLPAISAQLAINASTTGFVAAEISKTGRTFYATSINTTVSSTVPTVLPAGLSAPTFAVAAPAVWKDLNYTPSNWLDSTGAPYQVITAPTNISCTLTTENLGGISGAPAIIDMRGCAGGPIVGSSVTLNLTSDVTIFANQFNFGTATGLTFESATTASHHLWLVTPDYVSDGQPTCNTTIPEGDSTIQAGITVASTVQAVFYTPCALVEKNGAVWPGQLYTGALFASGGDSTVVPFSQAGM